MPLTPSGIGYDRAGPSSDSVLLVHAGVADRRMWQPQWDDLIAGHDTVRLDLRGFGESVAPPPDRLVSHPDDVLATLGHLGVERAHLVGASMGAGVATEVALAAPERVLSLALCPPGGSLLATMTDDLRAFIDAEDAALESGDLDAAVEANLTAWVVGKGRTADQVDPGVLAEVRRMQRRAFDVAEELGEWDEQEGDPLERLDEIGVPTLVLVGGHDLDTCLDAADRVTAGVPHARRVDWPDTAHLPSMEQPQRFTDLLRDWWGTAAG